MTRLSTYLLPTERNAPADAEAISHVLMVRAGLIRQLGAGIWTWLPAGWRAHQRAIALMREQMDQIGAQELLMPVLQPAESWRQTGRYDIPELFKLKDRREADLVLAMTHEEAVTQHVAGLVRSYRDLPLILYHFQVKERDEPRPRAGVLRTREFIMKDAYSFDRDAEGLDRSYQLHVEAYDRIMERSGLRYYRVQSDVGMMGGLGADEYMAPCPAGENEVALAPGYAANVEVACAEAQPVQLPAALERPRELQTPGLTSVQEVSNSLGLPAGALLKAYPVVLEGESSGEGLPSLRAGELVLALLRGDHSVNEIKLQNALGATVRQARAEEIEAQIGPVGYLGPVAMRTAAAVLLDSAVAAGCYVTGANRAGCHLEGVMPGRDFNFHAADIRSVQAGDLVGGNPIAIEPAIEVGNIFKLGLRYSTPLGASYLDEQGTQRPIWMGSYGLGPARIVAAAVEQYADERGISWPKALAPFQVHLLCLGRDGTPEQELAAALYQQLAAAGFDVLFDDRPARAGEKLTDAELLGCPLRLTVGRRSLESGLIEVQARRGLRALPDLPADARGAEFKAALERLWSDLP